jgi:hypothetical protein
MEEGVDRELRETVVRDLLQDICGICIRNARKLFYLEQ